MIRQLFITFLCIASLLLTACRSQPPGPPPTTVEIDTAKLQDWQASVKAVGTINTIQGAVLKSEVDGRVTKIAFTPGDNIAEGALLFEINPASLAAKYKSAQAASILAKANYLRAQQLYKQHFLAKADLDQAKANKDRGAADADAALADLRLAVIHAPFAGQVGLNQVNVGDYVKQGQNLVSLQQLDPLRIDFTVAEQYAGQIQAGDRVLLHVQNALFPSQIEGKVSAVDTMIDPDTRLLSVRANFANPKHVLLPGSFADVILFYGPHRQRLSVPQVAVISSADGDSIYRVEKQQAHKVKVTLGSRFDDQIMIDSGLKSGDEVVVAGQQKLQGDVAPIVIFNNKTIKS